LLTQVGIRVLAGAAAILLLVTVAFSGHANSQSPRGVLLPLDFVHVGAMSLWLGGLAMLLVAVPQATSAIQPSERTALLSRLLARFSPLALASVIALAASGVAQAYIHVRTLDALAETGYGRDVLAKTVLLLVLIGLGYTQRERVIPRLRGAVRSGEAPGVAGFMLRRVLRTEVMVVLAVLGVTAALVDYVPPVVQASGPVNVATRIGPAQLEMTVEPARVGVNEIHIYLFDARSGGPYAAAKEVTLSARLPAKGIGPEKLALDRAGPGHYIAAGSALVPAGTWELRLTVRISEFEEFSRELKVPIR
jgi:copper transport protein